MEPYEDTSLGTAGSEELVTPVLSWPAPTQSLRTAPAPRRRVLIAAIAVGVAAAIVGLAGTAFVQASQRRHANTVIESTRRDLATTQQQLDAARATIADEQSKSAAVRSEADDAERQIDDAKSLIEPEVAGGIASTDGVSADQANCIAHAVVKQLSLAELLQPDPPPDFEKTLLLAEAQCVTSTPTA